MERVETLGARLGQLMRERGLNYETLGRLLDMKPQTLNRYVLGQREPKAGVVMEMAARLGVSAPTTRCSSTGRPPQRAARLWPALWTGRRQP